MKKALSYVVVACILLMSLSGMSFAATTYQPTISAEGGNVGDTITVTVSLPANSGAAGGSFNLIYDNTKLELVDAVAGEIIAANNPTVNKTLAANKIRVNFAGLNPISANGGVALTATFKAIADGSAEFSTEKFKLADANTKYLTCTDATKSITIAGAGETVFKPTITVEGESDVNVKVSLPAGTNAAGGSFNLIYDNTKLELVDAKAGAAVPAATTTVNKTLAANKVRVSFAGTTPISANGGVALEVTFRAIADGTAAFEVEKFKLSNADGKYLICADAKTTANVKVDTTPVPVESVTLDKTSLTLTEGDSATLVATVAPTTATDKSVTWKTSDAKVATVANGVVTAKAAGKATITVTTVDGKKTATCNVTVEADTSIAAKFNLADMSARPGDIISVAVTLKSSVAVNSIALSGITYNENVLEFVEFADYEHLDSKTVIPIANFVDNANKTIMAPLKTAEAYDGAFCTIKFKVKENLEDSVVEINATSVIKNGSETIASAVIPASITIRNQMLGDIDLDDDVDIDDAVRLFQHSMLPSVYPIGYTGSIDFNKDNTVDIDDAVRLFQYSMLPDLYPIA